MCKYLFFWPHKWDGWYSAKDSLWEFRLCTKCGAVESRTNEEKLIKYIEDRISEIKNGKTVK